MADNGKLKWNLLMALLFSAIGAFIYLLIIDIGELEGHKEELLLTPEAFLTTVLAFNIFGFSAVKVNNYWNKKIPSFYERGRLLGWSFIPVGIFLLLVHFAVFWSISRLVGADHGFIFRERVLRLIFTTWLVEMMIVGLLFINLSYKHMLTLHKEKERLKETVNAAQYRALQNQLNPHFLFNNLNTLVAEIQYNPDNAVEFVQKLSNVYRYVLQQDDKQVSSLQEELSFLQSYLFLHQVRIGDCLTVERQLPEEVMEARLPSLTLQLLMENVLKHNCISDEFPMIIRINSVNNDRAISFSNPICPKQEIPSSGRGLKNLSERYKLLCGQDIDIQSVNNRFTVIIPLIYE
ncbi:histidine kinase [Parabacteroides johnsonii]|nr:histidine kinase [Parabacteroides johnsonii]